jgi:hypothetical protein
MTPPVSLARFGGGAAMLGVLIAFASVTIGPMVADPHDVPAVLADFAATPGLLHLHGLGVTVGTLLLLIGFHALASSLAAGQAQWWARVAFAAATVMTAFHLLGATLGGAVLPTLATQALVAGHDSAAVSAAAGLYILYEALLAPTFLTLTLTAVLFCRALLSASHYPAWLGWAGLLPAAWTGIGGIVFLLVGPLHAADMLLAFIPGFMLVKLWVFAVGATMWRVPATDPAPLPLPT